MRSRQSGMWRRRRTTTSRQIHRHRWVLPNSRLLLHSTLSTVSIFIAKYARISSYMTIRLPMLQVQSWRSFWLSWAFEYPNTGQKISGWIRNITAHRRLMKVFPANPRYDVHNKSENNSKSFKQCQCIFLIFRDSIAYQGRCHKQLLGTKEAFLRRSTFYFLCRTQMICLNGGRKSSIIKGCKERKRFLLATRWLSKIPRVLLS